VNAVRGCFVYCLVCLWSALAHAQSDELALVLPNCPGREAWQREVRELFQLELHVELSSQAPDGALPMLSVEQPCNAPSADALLRFRDPRTGANHTRVLSLRDAPPELRARVLALALSELLRSHWSLAAEGGQETPPPSAAEKTAEETPTHPTEKREPAPAPAPRPHADQPTKPAPTPARERQFALSLGPSLHVYFAQGSLLYGAELSLSWWRLSLGVLGSLGTNADSALGRASYRRVHGFVSVDIARLALGDWTWAAAVRGAFGGTFASGAAQSTVSSAQASDVSYDGSLETWLALRIADGWAAKLRANLGYAFGPRYLADGRVLADFSGLFLGVALNLTTRL
jgi:hypothetical protein